ncbi:hypothetical protein GEOBRER4_n2030 [Citrifermentans bremense]|uniref:SCP2 domain-containing protein n=1 Tax=Citrifermentans bremense TaxID=60035 RepID=A0A6S6M070_9BACT|nr:hypothetical protein [Citrifermentans bremense]BCG47203.1 hypothetical protein GEOBRER4_n2030 [Citrifermentans bremense]
MHEDQKLVEAITEEMGALFCKGVFTDRTVFRFNVGESSITVAISAESCEVEGVAGEAGCSCRTSAEMFSKIWYDGYRPGIMDFLGGAIKSDAPLLLPQFLRAFGKL